MDAMTIPTITPEMVLARAAAAGITIDPEMVEDIAHGMEAALAPLRTLDWRELRPLEPVVVFVPQGDE
jgi:hypothetical protein